MISSLLPHHVLIEPFEDDEPEGSLILNAQRESHVQYGWVLDTADDLEEDIPVGALVIFIGWKEAGIPPRHYAPWKEHLYTLHEDDIDLVLEDWD